METTIEYPDAELSASPTLGVVFRVPTQQDNADNGSEHSDYEDKRRSYIRPHSAKVPSLNLPSRVLPSRPKGIRPWSAQPKTSKVAPPAQRKVSRQILRKPHLRPPSRSPTASISSEASSLITAVGLAKKTADETSSPDSKPKGHHAKCFAPETKAESNKWAVKIAEAITETSEQEPETKDTTPPKPEPAQRTMKKHPSFETWLEGSPHDSDEYDTDIDTEDFIKTRPLDPTGTVMYMDQCEVQGIYPVSYIQRHLGDKNLRMRYHYLGPNGTKPIAVALLKNTVTETIDINDNYVESEGARYIAGMLQTNHFITSLNISNNFIGKDGFAAICKMLEMNTTMKTLCVSGNQLTDGCSECLIEGLKNNSSLTSLDLSNNSFGERTGLHIAGALAVNEGLIELDCSWNSLRNRGGAALLSCLSKNATLEVLDISWNGLGPVGAEALKLALKNNNTLKVLDLTNNRLNTKAAEDIAWGLSRNTKLETLVLNQNPLKDAGVLAILQAAEKHQKLFLLSIEEMGISRENYHKIQELQSKKDIVILHGGVGGYSRTSATTQMLRLFSQFVSSHQNELGTSFHQFDRDRTGVLSLDDLKMALKEAGLRLTNKQLTLVVDELNFRNLPDMNYKDIMSGQTLREYFLERPNRLFAMKTSQIDINTIPEMLHRQLTVT